MRLFLAVDLPKKVKHLLEQQILPVKKEYPQFEWVSEGNYHITVHFFGEINNVETIKKRLEEYLFDQESFYLYSYSVDLFINHRIVIYLDFRREKKLEVIARRVKESFQTHDSRTQKYVPHLTLARARIPSKQQYFVLKKRMSKLNIDISFQVKELVIFESILGGRTPVYKIVKKIPLL